LNNLQIRLDQLDKLVTPLTKVLVVAHLFGSIAPLDDVLSWAKQRGIFVIEDAAEAYIGKDYKGHPASDAVLFSFGTIKTSTAFGGAIMTVRCHVVGCHIMFVFWCLVYK
jgi:perosamine synthetase